MTDQQNPENADSVSPEEKMPETEAAKKVPKFIFPGAEEDTPSPSSPALNFPPDQDAAGSPPRGVCD